MKKLWISLVLVGLTIMVGCGGGSSAGSGGGGGVPPAVTLKSIQVAPGAASIAAGLGQQFTATGQYSDGSTKDLTGAASWSSSNTAAATISASGMATTKAAGSATITATDSGVSGSASLTVTAAALVSLAVSPATASMPVGLTAQLAATGTFTDGSQQDLTASVQWSSSNSALVAINANGKAGLALGVGVGSATVSAASGKISSSASVSVTNAILTGIGVTPLTSSIAQGTTAQFAAMGTYSDGSTQNITTSVQWTATNPGVAGMNWNGVAGLAIANAPGTSGIMAASGGFSASATLTVTNATLTSISITPANIQIPLGTSQQLTATGNFSDGTTQDISDVVTWTSSNSTYVSMTGSGLATARSLQGGQPTSVTITATAPATLGSVSGTTTATVVIVGLVSVAVTPTSITIAEGTSEQFSATGTYTDGSTRDLTTQAGWTSSNTGVATVGATWGLAKGLAPGSTNITATVNGISDSATLVVTDATIVSISVTPVGRSIPVGTKLAYTATGTFSDGSTQSLKGDATWASDQPGVATISGAGSATGVGAGTTDISATFGAVTGSTVLTVNALRLQSIAVTPETAVIAPASTLGYTAVGTYGDGSTQTITTAVTWTSSAPQVVSITSYGLATGQTAGSATITAQLGSVVGTASVVVGSSALVSVQISPTTATVAEQTGVQFQAIGTFADGTMQNLTNSASWASSSPAVATVSDAAGGFATGISPGMTTITALFGGTAGTASLTVTNASLTGINITPSDPSVALGGSQQFDAVGTFSDGSTEDLTTQASWNSSNANIATISSSGMATTAATGTATITASMNGTTGSTTITVY
ncbi:MAG: Ig-like domain-containing protein [Terriglobales bacterium]